MIDNDDLIIQLVTELRRERDAVELLVRYCDTRINTLHNSLAKRLINEREADTYRGMIAELKKLKDAVQNTGEML